MWRVWDDRFMIVLAAAVSAAVWYLRDLRAAEATKKGREQYKWWIVRVCGGALGIVPIRVLLLSLLDGALSWRAFIPDMGLLVS